jgi:surface polysaccharide O-acyltransferase-like enzyme
MLLILYGHLAGWAPLAALGPIYSKQLGVAFFLFATAYSLSRETRNRRQVVFNRLFEVYLFGVAVAVLVSAVSLAAGGRAQLSNYYPFIGGMNVLLNYFPANPTSWYLGTYLHVIALWALFGARLRVSTAVVLVTVALEIVIRAVLMETAGRFIAYMLVSNWATVLVLGYRFGQRDPLADERPADEHPAWGSIALTVVALGFAAVGWWLIAGQFPIEHTFPFMRLQAGSLGTSALFVSATVTILYVSATLLVFRVFERVPAPAAVTFVSRNTLLIFLLHMPLFRAMEPVVTEWTHSQALRSVIYIVVCLPGLALFSEAVRRVVRPRELRARLSARLAGRAALAPLEGSRDSPVSDAR